MPQPRILRNRELVSLIACVMQQCHGDFDMFLTRTSSGSQSTNLRVLAVALRLPAFVSTPSPDQVESLEALAILCRRLAEPCRLFTIADAFGRSVEAFSRIVRATATALYKTWSDVILFREALLVGRVDTYAGAIEAKSGLRGLRTCVAFIDGTKQYISRPSARAEGQEHENLQRSVYNGHPRRHCLNWQGITVPDGIIISMYGPVEGRRHDSTMLSMSRILDRMKEDGVLSRYCLYGYPAYGCHQCLSCPFPCAIPGSFEAIFNSSMSSVRETVEWSFHLVKGHPVACGHTPD
ncbi:hypothetical protein H257_06893 [Aphanomyces astaci]|uniref:DDE Tnp4 domain-containing protein n=1 Tax=Aphanomyces astaci TaxID=112090 RepID=W4GJY5_APHAT|nr:hypothetical protein H257_06893 [Aphanomyces astaci]ETV79636.1 hypothetical protein H257_06893 [Aphanomyces astaci]|eukprot:XP_009830572.1 hypothetical protein H257_06893 [Aphanomyces astaci]